MVPPDWQLKTRFQLFLLSPVSVSGGCIFTGFGPAAGTIGLDATLCDFIQMHHRAGIDPCHWCTKKRFLGGCKNRCPKSEWQIRLSCADASLRDAHLPITPHGPWPKQIIYIMAQVWKAGRQSHWTDIIGCLIIYVVTCTCIDTLKHSDLLWHIVASCVCGDSSDFLFITLSLSVMINLLFLTLSHSNNFPFICSS